MSAFPDIFSELHDFHSTFGGGGKFHEIMALSDATPSCVVIPDAAAILESEPKVFHEQAFDRKTHGPVLNISGLVYDYVDLEVGYLGVDYLSGFFRGIGQEVYEIP